MRTASAAGRTELGLCIEASIARRLRPRVQPSRKWDTVGPAAGAAPLQGRQDYFLLVDFFGLALTAFAFAVAGLPMRPSLPTA